MHVRILIDAIVHQTTILIAQLATTAGIRAPLAHVANQVFLDLVNELESQGVSRKVAADMFGMALRSYQQKVQRLSESATERGVTLWQAIYQYIQEQEVASRADILRRFRHDDVASVRGILHDLVESSLVYRSGRGDATIYRVMAEADIQRAGLDEPIESAAALAWVAIYRNGPVTQQQLEEMLAIDPELLEQAISSLLEEARIEQVDGDPSSFASGQCFIGLEDEAGWGAALFDHYQALVAALCTKLRNGETRALPDDRVGGSTFSFDVWEGHPHEQEVYALLNNTRSSLIELWDRVTEHNQVSGKPEDTSKVTFYFGQSVQLDHSHMDDP